MPDAVRTGCAEHPGRVAKAICTSRRATRSFRCTHARPGLHFRGAHPSVTDTGRPSGGMRAPSCDAGAYYRVLLATCPMDRVRSQALQAEVLHFEDLLREEMKALVRAIADDPVAARTRLCRERCHALRIDLLRMIQQVGHDDEDNAIRLRVLQLDRDLDRLISTHSGFTSSPRARYNLRVLVVDDYDVSAEILGAVLEGFGCLVRTAHNAEEAIGVASHFEPHMVFLDLAMPQVDGFTAASRLRRQSCSVTLVAYSGLIEPDTGQRCMEAGFQYFLRKPATVEQFEDILRKVAHPPAQ